jgi:hypothetical protein
MTWPPSHATRILQPASRHPSFDLYVAKRRLDCAESCPRNLLEGEAGDVHAGLTACDETLRIASLMIHHRPHAGTPLQARDTFYECVEAAGVTYTVDAPIPAACKSARAAYDKACKASWVKHFDLLQVCESQVNSRMSSTCRAQAAVAGMHWHLSLHELACACLCC